MTQTQFIKEFKKFYIKDINNSRKKEDIEYREYLIERLLNTILTNCYLINNGEIEEKEYIEQEYNILLQEFGDEYSGYMEHCYGLINTHLLIKNKILEVQND